MNNNLILLLLVILAFADGYGIATLNTRGDLLGGVADKEFACAGKLDPKVVAKELAEDIKDHKYRLVQRYVEGMLKECYKKETQHEN